MAETNPCVCADPSTGPTKSTASSFSFQMCDGGNLVTVPATQIADYVINVIYGDTNGNAPASGCYSVCYDSNGNRFINLVSTPTIDREFILQEAETIFPVGAATPDSRLGWALPNPSYFLFGSQPPAGVVPTFARLRFISNFGDDDSKVVDIRDKFNNPVYLVNGFNDDDDGAHTGEAWVPIDENGDGEYGVFLNGSSRQADLNIKLVGYTTAALLQPDGTTTSETTTGGNVGTVTPTQGVDPNPLEISFFEHRCTSPNNTTTIEWFKNQALTETVDDYTLYIDFGGGMVQQITVPHVGGSGVKQRLDITWSTDQAIKLDAKISDGTNFGSARTSNLGTTDPLIVPPNTSSQTI